MGFYTREFSAHPTTRELVQTRWLLRKGAVIIYQHEGLHYFRAIWKKWRPPPIEWRKKWPPPLLRNAEKMTSPCAKREKWFVALICIFGTFQRKKMVTPHIEWEKKSWPPPYWKKKKIMTMFQFSFSVQVVFSCMFIIFSNHYLCIGVGSTRWPQDKKQFFFISGSLSTRPERQLFIDVKWFVHIAKKSDGTSTRPEWQHFMGVKWLDLKKKIL